MLVFRCREVSARNQPIHLAHPDGEARSQIVLVYIRYE